MDSARSSSGPYPCFPKNCGARTLTEFFREILTEFSRDGQDREPSRGEEGDGEAALTGGEAECQARMRQGTLS